PTEFAQEFFDSARRRRAGRRTGRGEKASRAVPAAPPLEALRRRLRIRRRAAGFDRTNALVSQQLRNDRARVRVYPRAWRRRAGDGEPAGHPRCELRAQTSATALSECDRRALDA